MPGVPDILNLLSAQNDILLSIATGNFEEAGWMKLEYGGIDQYFKFGGFGSDSPSRVNIVQTAIQRGEKFLLEKIPFHQVFVIGDTEHDINAAKVLGVKSIGVGAYHLSKDDLSKHEPDFVMDDLQNAEAFLELVR
ncbi:MAG: hypothetical protein A3G33_07780 [Omnitrophica bacterium RIFCSPLOWO2_12_FULL_44_17]|uniref:HAD family hydrolase n=1 Tax=Candidatus Danuiimicrobium aquiferis TaxID=1801832 RepID=A0A1G1L1X7_9BACT|nr:MAG: hypothetical protein A3B72_02335 [Omnitrophica bacterium RIFCSPHIGHO2_02_FULL_45_28]OGW88881.1 MAG: hypothetical protein A3E74_10155 [Omnitrophica bacterium RIFCSPHIGHO2_12_FULL_44_12]OGW99118.1 MAG: hypothetical protein A3G33_07780 [Omnitrophica bacterium RIFCSPLOWO2_12_FULL_44_17]OGX02613.1 MAG: hypothetical protein A3J12_02015 [Omnitrophica bacterium RIFCSPLOWO2_02_FULL_44_11]